MNFYTIFARVGERSSENILREVSAATVWRQLPLRYSFGEEGFRKGIRISSAFLKMYSARMRGGFGKNGGKKKNSHHSKV